MRQNLVLDFVIDEQKIHPRGREIPANWTHDRGAYGRCSGCGRYSDNPQILKADHYKKCDCGKAQYFSGSFIPPGLDAAWNEGKLAVGN